MHTKKKYTLALQYIQWLCGNGTGQAASQVNSEKERKKKDCYAIASLNSATGKSVKDKRQMHTHRSR